MILVAEMQNGGVFEAISKRKLTNQMIQHFAENDCDAGQIKAIYCIFKNDRTDELCGENIAKIQDIVDEGVSEWRKIAAEEWRGQKEIEREFRAGLL